MKLARMLGAIGVMAAMAGCRTCIVDRDDDRPMKHGSVRDCCSYGWWGECFHPKYHFGPPDGIRDHVSVKKAAVKAANQSLSDQCGDDVSRDFKLGYQQAYIDISNGGSGAMPAVPPPRYWAAPYRTTWGHNKARDWFSGYEAGAGSAKCCMSANTLSVPTSVYRDCDNRLAIGMDGGSYGAAPVVNANYGWPGNGMPYSPSPTIYNPPMMSPYGNPMNVPAMNGHVPYGVSSGASASPPMMTPPGMPAPSLEGFPGGGWSIGPSPALPSQPVPNAPVPAPASGGYSLPSPSDAIANPPIAPMHGHHLPPPPAAPQNGFSPNNPWGRFSGVNGFGFQPEGASR